MTVNTKRPDWANNADHFIDLWQSGMKATDIAKFYGKKEGSVYNRAAVLGLKKRPQGKNAKLPVSRNDVVFRFDKILPGEFDALQAVDDIVKVLNECPAAKLEQLMRIVLLVIRSNTKQTD